MKNVFRTYLTNVELFAKLEELAEKYPNLSTTYDLDFRSVENRPLKVIRISKNVREVRGVTSVLYEVINFSGFQI